MRNLSKEEVVRFIRDNKGEFLNKYGVRRIGLFGSIIRNALTDDSDIDIVIEMDPEKKNLHNFLRFKRYLEKEFGRQVDLGIESTLKKAVRQAIEKEIFYV
jgi:predicted nucleotidyltransferase